MTKNYIDSRDINFDNGLLKSPLEKKIDNTFERGREAIVLLAGSVFLYQEIIKPLANYLIK